MRAPPEAANSTSGRFFSSAVSKPRMIASPAAMPSEPPMKAKSCTGRRSAGPRSCRRVEDGVVQPGLGAGVLQPVGVALLVAELQRIDGDLRVVEQLVLAVVEEELQPLLGRDPHVVAGDGMTNWLLLEIPVEDHLAGLGTLDPEVFRHLARPSTS